MESDILFAVSTLLSFRVRVTHSYWELIVTVQHPVMRERATEVQDVLHTSDEVRQGRSDPAVFLFDRAEVPGRGVCAVAKRLNDEGSSSQPLPPMRSKKGNGYEAGKDCP
jgi:hypothetical protein